MVTRCSPLTYFQYTLLLLKEESAAAAAVCFFHRHHIDSPHRPFPWVERTPSTFRDRLRCWLDAFTFRRNPRFSAWFFSICHRAESDRVWQGPPPKSQDLPRQKGVVPSRPKRNRRPRTILKFCVGLWKNPDPKIKGQLIGTVSITNIITGHLVTTPAMKEARI